MQKYHSNRVPLQQNCKDQSECKGRSLKGSNSITNKHHSCLTKRLSLQYKPLKRYPRNSIIDDIEQYQYLQKHVNKISCNNLAHEKQSQHNISRGLEKDKMIKMKSDNNQKVKYYAKTKSKTSKPMNKIKNSNVAKGKRVFSEFSRKQVSKSNKSSKFINYNSREMESDYTTHAHSSQLYRNSPLHQMTLKNAQSMLNSTIVTKNISEDQKAPVQHMNYKFLVDRLKQVLQCYHKKIHILKKEKQFYRVQWRLQKKKNGL